MPKTIADNMVVSLAYTLTVDGEEIERTGADDPLDYLHGWDNIVSGLEAALTGKSVGDKFSITLAPEDAYGEYDDEDIETLDRAEIPDSDQLEVGMMVEIEDLDGNFYEAVITEFNNDVVVLDYNPPLAGKTLTFDVEVVAVRDADAGELDHGHPHSDGMHDHDD